jgi:hypothetical protein
VSRVSQARLLEVPAKTRLVFGPDPFSHSRCVIGGNIGNNSCGIHSAQAHLYGPGPRTSDSVHAAVRKVSPGGRAVVTPTVGP